jgi:hypothetical protein
MELHILLRCLQSRRPFDPSDCDIAGLTNQGAYSSGGVVVVDKQAGGSLAPILRFFATTATSAVLRRQHRFRLCRG